MAIAASLGNDMTPTLYSRIICGVVAYLSMHSAHAELHVLIVEGLGGEEKYTQAFDNEVKALRAASSTLTRAEHIHVLAGAAAKREAVLATFKQLATTLKKDDRFACYLVGHGSYDGYEYKFNLPGPDLTAADLSRALAALPTDDQLIVATGSAAGALQEALDKPHRVVITATRNGNERNATQFGASFAATLSDAGADADKDGRVSAQEAFDSAARKVKDYFVAESRLATEHAVLQGASAKVFAIAQLGGASTLDLANADPTLAAERVYLDSQIDALRLRKNGLGENEYFKQLEPLLVKLAEVDMQLEAKRGAP